MTESKFPADCTTALRSRFRPLFLYGLVFLCASFALRVALLIQAWSIADTAPAALAYAFAAGLFFDLLGCSVAVLPLSLYLALASNRFLARPAGKIICLAIYATGLFVFFYGIPVEWFYWIEFPSTRFNLVAVDYLKDIDVVVSNIWQSYPIVPITIGVLIITAIPVLLNARSVVASCAVPVSRRGRIMFGGSHAFLIAVALLFIFNQTWSHTSSNWTNSNVAKNGLLSLITAFANVNFTYSEVEYLTRDDAQTMARLRGLLKTDRTEYVNKTGLDITRRIDGGPNPQPRNVVIIVVESLSAEFLGVFGNPKNLTPNLDKLADKSILFTRLYACGTRTIRGLEAINLSLPPTPGRAVAKRRGSHKLFSAEHLMRQMGYRTLFFYGGHANFDNMDQFLCRGGFELIDDRKFRPEDIHFRSPWGICDGDVYHRAIAEFDATHQAGRKFYSMIMTVSNHIPFTYPKVIDIPSPSMFGAVKYSDYAIGQFLNEARSKPWFKDTIFVIVADHCQRHRAKSDSSPTKYHIPAFIYSPDSEIAKPQRINSLCSQIDLVPTVLGLMRASYTSKFFGQDVLLRPPERAFVGTPLDLGFLVGNRKIVLSPAHKAATYVVAAEEETQVPNTEDELATAIAYYQGMGYMMRNRLQLQDAN